MHARWTTPVTQALRSGSVESLRAELLRLLVAGRGLDLRDLLVVLAPYHDCAARMGVDPAAVFAEVAAACPLPLRDAVRGFGRRTDIRPEEWGFAVVDTVDGPRYQQRSVRTPGEHS